MISDQTRRLKSREVSSRYLSSTISSPPLGPNHNNPKLSTLSTKQKHRHTGFIWGLWPSSANHSTKSRNENQPTAKTTLADHLGNEKRKDGPKRSENSSFLSKQNSCSEFRRSENNMNNKSSNLKKQYHSPSMRYSERSSISSVSTSTSTSASASSVKSLDVFDSNQVILPGRLSVDENALRRRSSYYQMRSDPYYENSESSDLGSPFTIGRNSPASYMAPTLSSIKSGIDVQSKYMNSSMSMHNSFKKSASVKRASSPLSEWESSPSRFGLGSPLFSGSKPPSSSCRGKKNLLHMGLDLIKGKKGGSKLRSSSGSDIGIDTMENVHQLRLLQNSWMQWRFTNARAQDVNENLAAQCELDLLYAREGMAKLQQSVVQKRLQLQKEKLEMKLNVIIDSQINLLGSWGDIERRHKVDISVMKDYLHAVVCMIPLIEGAKVDLESATIAFRHTSHLVATTKSMLSTFSPMAHDMLSELADVATQEKLLLEECFEHLRIISILEIQERNLRCSIIAMDSLYEQQQQLNQ